MGKEVIVAKNIKDAFSKNKSGYGFFAGGTEINRLNSPCKNQKFVSLKNCGLDNVESETSLSLSGKEVSFVKIGALATFQSLIEKKIVPDKLKVALRFCESLQKRYMATIGGNIASNRDDSYLISTLCALDCELAISGKNKRISIFDYISQDNKIDRFSSLIEYIYIPVNERKVLSTRNAITASSSATLTASISCSKNLSDFIIVATIKTLRTIRLYQAEQYLKDKNISSWNDKDFSQLLEFINTNIDVDIKNDLIYGSGKYKKYLLSATVSSMIEELSK